MDNIITATFGAMRETRTPPRHQYDYGQILQIRGVTRLPDTYEVHFGNEGSAVAMRVLSDGGQAAIPDALLTTGKDVLAWIFVHTEATDGETVYRVRIPVIPRPRPEDYEPTPAQVGIVEQAIEMLNREIDDIENAHQNALDAQAAQRAAETARDAAGESATNASQSAGNAANAAASASSSAQSAAASQTAAETAQGRAEQAADDAEHHSIGMWLDGTKLILTSPREG